MAKTLQTLPQVEAAAEKIRVRVRAGCNDVKKLLAKTTERAIKNRRNLVRTHTEIIGDFKRYRMTECSRLRICGMSIQEIARKFGMTPAMVRADCEAYFEAYAQLHAADAVRWREIEDQRYELLINAAWKKAMTGDVRSINVTRQLMSDKHTLLGLNKPINDADSKVDYVEVLRDIHKELGRKFDKLLSGGFETAIEIDPESYEVTPTEPEDH